MPEDGAAGVARGEDGEDAHGAAAGVAAQAVDGEHALHERGPGEPTERAGAAAGGVLRSGRTRRDDGGAERVVGGEHAVIAGEVRPRRRDRRDQGREATQELEGREHELGAPVAQRTLEGDPDPAGGVARQPGAGDRRAGTVAAPPFEQDISRSVEIDLVDAASERAQATQALDASRAVTSHVIDLPGRTSSAR